MKEVKKAKTTAGHNYKASVAVEDIMRAYDMGEVSRLRRLIFATEGYCGVVHEMRRIRQHQVLKKCARPFSVAKSILSVRKNPSTINVRLTSLCFEDGFSPLIISYHGQYLQERD